jgi:hypothetical protein
VGGCAYRIQRVQSLTVVKKSSLAEWLDERQDVFLLARQPAAREAAAPVVEGIVRELQALGETFEDEPAVAVQVSELEFEVWVTVEVARARVTTTDTLAQLLRNEFGSEEAAGDALQVYVDVRERLEEAGTAASPSIETDQLRRDEHRLREFVRVRAAQPRLALREIMRYSAIRAQELGFSPAVIWAKGQGRRSERLAAEKRARSRIVVELRDRGAILGDIGAVFGGRSKEAVFGLEQAGRGEEREEQS